jgi:hypothetical protein
MRRLLHQLLTLGLLLGGIAAARADEQADCKAIIEKSVAARGGSEKLLKYTAATTKVKGMFHGLGQAIPVEGELAMQWPDKSRIAIEMDAMGLQFKFIAVYDGKQGWRRVNDDVTELSPEQLAEQKHSAYHGYVTSLAALLKDKQVTFKSLGESKVDDKPAVGVKVSKAGHRDVSLYFDKDTGLLAKSKVKVKDVERDQEFTQETLYGAYKDFNGVKHATKQGTKRDGTPFLELEVVELKPVEKLEPSVFAKP